MKNAKTKENFKNEYHCALNKTLGCILDTRNTVFTINSRVASDFSLWGWSHWFKPRWSAKQKKRGKCWSFTTTRIPGQLLTNFIVIEKKMTWSFLRKCYRSERVWFFVIFKTLMRNIDLIYKRKEQMVEAQIEWK